MMEKTSWDLVDSLYSKTRLCLIYTVGNDSAYLFVNSSCAIVNSHT